MHTPNQVRFYYSRCLLLQHVSNHVTCHMYRILGWKEIYSHLSIDHGCWHLWKTHHITSISMLLAGNVSCSTWNASFCLKIVIDHVWASTLKWGCGGWRVCRAHGLKMAACLNLFWTRTTGRNFPCNTWPQQTCPNTHWEESKLPSDTTTPTVDRKDSETVDKDLYL